MSGSTEGGEACELDAIESVATEGYRRSRSGIRKTLFITVAGLLIAGAAAAITVWNSRLPPLAAVPVAVFLPCTNQAAECEGRPNLVADNAERQWQGFSEAFIDNSVQKQNRHVHYFDYPIKKDDATVPESIMQQMKHWYYEDGIRIFIITMSGAVTPVKRKFEEWVGDMDDNGDRPVLVATVASAPGLANRVKGVLRYYIRTKDEADLMSAAIESWGAGATRVFHVNDAYGLTAKDELQTRLGESASAAVFPANVSKDAISEDLQEWIAESSTIDYAVAIVGYGAMVSNAVLSLRDNNFSGNTIVVSTYTEKRWRAPEPANVASCSMEPLRVDCNVYAVGPVGYRSEREERYLGVVFQFSYLTLDRALKCKDRRGVEYFWECWSDKGNDREAHQAYVPVEFTADGDSHVRLKLLSHSDMVK